MKSKKFIILSLIVIVAAILRFWNLGGVPLSPDWDEVALGYNAYSVMVTGKDEYGKVFPVILRSFDDYKPALYAYLTIPSIKLFGLFTFAVRLPSAIVGTLTIILTYLLIKEIFSKEKQKEDGMDIVEVLALLSSFLLAISPWHIQFSRVAFEANVGLALNICAILFFLKGLKKPWFLSLSVILMSLNLYVYQSEKVLTPLLFLILIFIFREHLLKIKKKYIVVALFFGLLISLPLIIFTTTNGDTFARARGVSIFANNTPLLRENLKEIARDKATGNKISLILDNRRVTYAKTIIANYISHFDFNWLFIKGDFENNRHHAPNMGLLYIFELPFLFIGIYIFLFGELSKGIDKKYKILIISLLLITPIPASITRDVPHAVRTLQFLPFIQILIAFGILSTFIFIKQRVKNIFVKSFYMSFILVFFVLNFLYFLDQYFVQLNYYYAKDWQYGYKELIDYLNPIQNKYSKIIVSNKATMDQSYMFFLFYLRYDPIKYLEEGGTKSGGFGEKGNRFFNFEFRPFDYYSEKEHKILFIGSPSDFQEEFKTIHTILYPNGDIAIKVVEKD